MGIKVQSSYKQSNVSLKMIFKKYIHLNPDDLARLANTPVQAESLLDSVEQAANGIGLR